MAPALVVITTLEISRLYSRDLLTLSTGMSTALTVAMMRMAVEDRARVELGFKPSSASRGLVQIRGYGSRAQRHDGCRVGQSVGRVHSAHFVRASCYLM